jgi:formamidopyrimidine-DNA glycosylase
MPELPEVETTRLGLLPHLLGRRIQSMQLRRQDLRWPIPEQVQSLQGAVITALRRRAKYILLDTEQGSALWHLGMSGSLRMQNHDAPLRTHDHVIWRLDSDLELRFHDPRRFGCLLYLPNASLAQTANKASGAMSAEALLQQLGPEPLSDDFSADRLFQQTRGRHTPIKHFLMDQKNVVGVGNIYAAESLFLAGIRPMRAAHRIKRAEAEKLVALIKQILRDAITQGGTTLRDFVNPDGQPGYFEQALFVYGREGQPCKICASPIRAAKLGTRQSCYCPRCQK